MTFKEYVEHIVQLLKEHPEWAELEVSPCEHWEEDSIAFPELNERGYINV